MTVIHNYYYFSCNCRPCLTKPELISITKESDVDYIARFSDAVPNQLIVSRVLTVFDAQNPNGRQVPASDPTANSIAFSCEPSPGDNGSAFLTDTNVIGDHLDSNSLEFSLTPLPPTPDPLTAPVLLSISPVVNAGAKGGRNGGGKRFGR